MSMNDIANIGFVNSHAERYRCTDNADAVVEKSFLNAAAFRGRHSRMIRACQNAGTPEAFCNLLTAFSGETVDNT